MSDPEQMLWPAASQNSCMTSWLPAERRQPGPRAGSHVPGHRAPCSAGRGGPCWLQHTRSCQHRVGAAIALCPQTGRIPHHSPLAGALLGFVVVMDVPPHDSHSKCKAQLLPLLGDPGPVAFEVESLWVLATQAFVPSAAKDVIFLTACPCFVVTPHLAPSH